MTAPVRTLHIDIEGGLGGSSRSLFELVSRLDRDRINPVVAYRVDGPIVERYRQIGVPTYHVPQIVSYAPREHKSLKNLIASMPRIMQMGAAVDSIAAIAKKHDAQVIHLNYEGLFLMAPRLTKRLGLPMAGHSRTQIPNNMWGQWEARTLAKNVSHMFFISPMEQAAFARHADCPGEVLWNIATPPPAAPSFPDEPVAVYLGNIDHVKGADRLVDIAQALEEMNAPPLKIAVYGSARNTAEYLESLKRRVVSQNLGTRIAFEGHTSDPEGVLSRALALIRVSRWNDPWGRDVIEATRAGIPVLATGTMDGVVENGKTGFLYADFKANDIAMDLVRLAADRAYWERLSAYATAKGERQFSGVHQAQRAMDVFEQLAQL